ncbi:RWD-domain-containing protein [Panaeolus papilionaceus]|nr:RWD-domain-containing protein [Panaeolus papilionaceus]
MESSNKSSPTTPTSLIASTPHSTIQHGHTEELIQQCLLSQQDELIALESIFPDCILNNPANGSLKLQISIQFSEARSVLITSPSPSSSDDTNTPTESIQTLSVTTLPPLVFTITLPLTYPLLAPPEILSVQATHAWLPEVSALTRSLLAMWQLGENILYGWIDYLQAGEFLHDLGYISTDDQDCIKILHPAPPILAPLLLQYNHTTTSSLFSQSTYACSICLEHHKGSKCIQLPSCSHVFCHPCLSDFWGMCIQEGDVDRVGCPDPECVKQKSVVGEEEVARVVSAGEVERWRWLVQKKEFDRDPSIVYCPFNGCQSPVRKPQGVEPDSGWDRFRQCDSCHYAFCAFCKYTWHGPITACRIEHRDLVVHEYLSALEDSPERDFLEKRYGAALVKRLVEQHMQDEACKQWIDQSTTVCPGCEVNVQKSEGCNHMSCWKCTHHFCYRCGISLDPAAPYAHFSDEKSGCFKKLFDWEVPVGDGWQ